MNFKISTLLLFLEFMKSSSNDSSQIKSNQINSLKNTTININIALNKTVNERGTSILLPNSKLTSNKKWKIGRVTNKQFGIINILWKKTKIFIDQDYPNLTCKATTIEMTPETPTPKTSSKRISKLSTLSTSTPSYIEFYYMEQSDDRIKRKHPSNTKLSKLKKSNKTNVDHSSNKKSSIPTLFKIHINTIQRKHPPHPTHNPIHKFGQGNIYRNKLNISKRTTFVSKVPITVATKAKIRTSKQTKMYRSQLPTDLIAKTIPVNSKSKTNQRKEYMSKKKSYSKKVVTGTTYEIKSLLLPVRTATAYDKVKFFEMYDNNTPKWQNHIQSNLSNTLYDINIEVKHYRDNEQVLLHHVNENIGHQQDKNKTRYVKKHVQDLYITEGKSQNEIDISKHPRQPDIFFLLNIPKDQVSFQMNYTYSRPAAWSEYPFVAVYVYEPSKVHCDAAGISPHWLLSAASCLSRHRKGLRGGGLSAFVTFCSDDWRYPQMISYVKRTIIHPMYHPKDRLRHLFNAGLVQVVNSMGETCSGWAPASLMSHQFTADTKGSIGTAVGWGLDRYDESYATKGIPNHPLMLYEGFVYSETCPGSSEYSNSRSSDKEDIKNLYCLLLPPYIAEENDTVHGAMLLIGGKLVALYLKEERRPWGVQSAQYAGIWRLLPWLAETAREPDESFQFEI